MPEFPYARLRRAPDVEAAELQAWDATDPLLARSALSSGVEGHEIAVIGDSYGAITLALAHAGLSGIRMHQDLVTGRRALARNALALGVGGFTSHELDESLLDGARLVVMQLPKALAELEEIADAIVRWANAQVTLVAGGRVKHMTLAQNEVLGRFFSTVQPQLAERKSRLVVASGARPVADARPYPQLEHHPEFGITLAAHGGVFAGTKVDIGTRTLLETFDRMPDAAEVVDLGCGTGALAVVYARAHSTARVIATDCSASAVASARATMAANGLADRTAVTLDDAGSELPDACADLVLLNPPFHLGTSIHTGAATRLFQAAARILRPDGELWTVYNSRLRYATELVRAVGHTEQIRRTPKFTVTRSVRR